MESLYEYEYNVSEAQCYNETTFLPNSILIIASVTYGLLFFFGITGNMLVAYVIWRNVDMRSSTNYFLVNLCIADLLVLVVCMPSGLLEVFTPTQWLLGKAMCFISPFLENVTAQASIMTLMAIAFERYYVIWRPLEVSYTCTTKRTVMVCVIVWILASICSIPPVVMTEYNSCTDFDGNFQFICSIYIVNSLEKAYVICTTFVFFFLPCLFLGIVYAMFANTLRKHDQFMNSLQQKEKQDRPLELSPVKKYNFMNKKYIKCATTPNEESKTERDKLCAAGINRTSSPSKHGDKFSSSNRHTQRRMILMLGSVVVVFFICWLPIRVMILWQIFVSDEGFARLNLQSLMTIITFNRIMLYINSSINPLLYNLISTKFRDAFKDVLCCRATKKRGLRKRGAGSFRSYTSNSSFHHTRQTDFSG